MKKFFPCLLWFILFMAGSTYGLNLITEPNTWANLAGVFILGLVVSISIETKCLTQFKIKRSKNEK